MRRRILALVFLVAALLPPTVFGQRCGVERWSVKTGTDNDAGNIDLANPQQTTIANLIELPAPSPIPKDHRVNPTETTLFVVNATLTDFKLETGKTGDSDYHLVLQDDQGRTMVAEIPSPHCVDDASPFASQIASARAKFDAQFTATSSFQTANVPVQVKGVGFFDFFHNQNGAAPNVIELHPVLDIDFNLQPGPDDFSFMAPSTVQLTQGGTRSITIAPTGAGAAFTLSTSGLPSGVSAHVDKGNNGQATLTLKASASSSVGSFPFTLTGAAGSKTHSQIIALNLSAGSQSPEGHEWEYKMISATTEGEILKQADLLGADEWEMVSVVKVSGTPAWRAFFKRMKRDF